MTALPLRTPSRAPRPASPAARRSRLRLVSPPRHTGRWFLLLVAVAAAGIFGIVSLSALAAEQAFAARALQAEVTELRHRYEELTAEVARLESPARVREVAEHELGMVPAEQPAYLVVDDGSPFTPVAHVEDVGGRADGPLADPVKSALGAGD